MYMFMAWMTGSQLNVYTIFILQPLIMGPFTALMTMDKREAAAVVRARIAGASLAGSRPASPLAASADLVLRRV